MKYDITIADGTEHIEATNWDGITECVAGQLIMDCGAAGTRVYDSFGDLLVDFPDADED
jgi:hypothetical protein